jgi:DNA-binding response OmpR family regulator
VAETVLIVEDEPEFADLVALWMTDAGYRPVTARTGPDGLRRFYDERPDLVILDVALPGLDGWQLLERFREFSRVPILMVTARGAEAEKVRGLKLGADDYITKPLSFPELAARVEAALRRAATAAPERPRRLRHRDLVVDLDEHHAHVDGVAVALTPTEFRLLAYLVEHAGQLVTHRQVLGAVWGAGYDRDVHLLRMTIRNLRLKLEAAAPGSGYITTEYGLGYRLTGPGAAASGSGRTESADERDIEPT